MNLLKPTYTKNEIDQIQLAGDWLIDLEAFTTVQGVTPFDELKTDIGTLYWQKSKKGKAVLFCDELPVRGMSGHARIEIVSFLKERINQ